MRRVLGNREGQVRDFTTHSNCDRGMDSLNVCNGLDTVCVVWVEPVCPQTSQTGGSFTGAWPLLPTIDPGPPSPSHHLNPLVCYFSSLLPQYWWVCLGGEGRSKGQGNPQLLSVSWGLHRPLHRLLPQPLPPSHTANRAT